MRYWSNWSRFQILVIDFFFNFFINFTHNRTIKHKHKNYNDKISPFLHVIASNNVQTELDNSHTAIQ